MHDLGEEVSSHDSKEVQTDGKAIGDGLSGYIEPLKIRHFVSKVAGFERGSMEKLYLFYA